MSIGAKFNRMFDTKALAQDVKKVEESNGEYKKVPTGNYEVRIQKIELKENKNGDPMVSMWFEIVAGEYKNSKLFYNQVIDEDFKIGILNNFLRKLGTGLEIEFNDYVQYEQLLAKIYDRTYGKLEYGLDYAETKNGYTTYKITDIFELTQKQPKTETKRAVLEPVYDDEELPFD